MRAVLIFCEGQHDVVFVLRSLGAAGCTWLSSPLKELPSPFGNIDGQADTSFVAKRIAKRSVGDVELRAANQAQPPSFQCFLEDKATDTLYAVLRCNGDSAAGPAKDLLSELSGLISGDIGPFLQVTSVATAFLYDADTSTSERERRFQASFGTLITDPSLFRHRTWNSSPRGPVGLYIFANPATGDGTLEDLLAPLVEARWPPRWKAAGEYLSQHADPDDPIMKKRSEMLKAHVCTVGQFIFPGDPLSVVLGRHERGLPKEVFLSSVSTDLVAFLRGAF